MTDKELPKCANCRIESQKKACQAENGNAPAFCPTEQMKETLDNSKRYLNDSEVYEFSRQASIQEAECYINRDNIPHVLHPVKPRIQEICEFAERMGYKRLGLAYCGGLQFEASLVNKVIENYGYNVASVACKVGCFPKEIIEIKDFQKVRIGEFEPMCNPIAQAEILNAVNTQFNIILGLCVGHDSLFFMHAKAPTTVLAAKDRVLGHNPLAVIYTLNTYYERFSKA